MRSLHATGKRLRTLPIRPEDLLNWFALESLNSCSQVHELLAGEAPCSGPGIRPIEACLGPGHEG